MKRHSVAVLAGFLILMSSAAAQGSDWSLRLGGAGLDHANAVQQTSDGGLIAAGYSSSSGAGGTDVLVFKLDAAGAVSWKNTYGGSNDDSAAAVQQTSDGGYIVAGYTASSGAGLKDVWVLKLNGNGSVAWQKTYGRAYDDEAKAIQQTSDGGYVVAGHTANITGNIDAWVLRLDADGGITWQKTYGDLGEDKANSIRQTADGGFIVAGYTYSGGYGHCDVWVLKLDGNGSVAWQKIYGDVGFDIAYAVRQTSDGGYIVAASSNSFGSGGYPLGLNDAWVLKLDAEGLVQWQKAYGGISDDYAYAVVQTADGGILVAGSTAFSGADSGDAWVLKLDAEGSILMQKTYGGTGTDIAYAIGQATDGGVIVAGVTASFGAVLDDAWVLRLDQRGGIMGCSGVAIGISNGASVVTDASSVAFPAPDSTDLTISSATGVSAASSTASAATNCSYSDPGLTWMKTYGGADYDSSNDIQQTADGGFIVAGYTRSYGTAGSDDLWVLKLNTDGSTAWQKTYGGSGTEVANSVRQTADGGYIVAGSNASSGQGGKDVWVLKLASDGAVTWQKTFGGAYDDLAYAVQQTSDGGYVVAGYTQSFGAGFTDAWVIKLTSDGSVAWQKTYGGGNADLFNDIQQTADGGYIAAGGTTTFGAGSLDAWVVRLDSFGGIVWQNTYGGSDYDEAGAIQQTADGGYIVAAQTASFGDNGGYYDVWIIKLNAGGSIAWQKTYGGPGAHDRVYAIQQTADGGYVFTGPTGAFSVGWDGVWVVRLNADGSVAWHKVYSGSFGWAIRQTADGGYVVAGRSAGAGYDDIGVMRLDQLGDVDGCGGVHVPTPVVPQVSFVLPEATDVIPAAGTGLAGTTVVGAVATSVVPGAVCSATSTRYLLGLSFYGTGTGSVTSSPSGMDCTTDCAWFFGSGGAVTLSAVPDGLGSFTGWSGACDSGGQVAMNADKICYATFTTPADFLGTPLIGTAPLVVDFSDNSSHTPTQWEWDFGDYGLTSGSAPTHIYRYPGLYTVTLTATSAGGAATARKFDYITVVSCQTKPARITGPAYHDTITAAYGGLGGDGNIDLQATEFVENVNLSTAKDVAVTGGYSCDYGSPIGDSVIRGSLTISGNGTVILGGLSIY